jgi:tetratricopeptide (TPR) repeat protein
MRLVKPEAGFYVAMVSANLLNDKKEALPFVAQIENDNPAISANPLLVYGCATILMKNGLNDEALALLSSRKTLKGSYPFQFLDYLEGMARLNKLDPGAELNFQRYIDRFKGMNYIKAAWQKIAWSGLLRGDSATYRQAMLRVKQSGVTQVDEDKQALREAESEMVPSVVLLRARLLFDGGYYQMALGELLNVPLASYVKDRRDLVEYYYRSARIYHESGNLIKALGFYEQTIQRGRAAPWYYAAAAAYQMGLIREQRQQYHEADSAYRICLSMDPAEYKTSLHQKAKAGLARIKPYLD